jgi:hypothetical protein
MTGITKYCNTNVDYTMEPLRKLKVCIAEDLKLADADAVLLITTVHA